MQGCSRQKNSVESASYNNTVNKSNETRIIRTSSPLGALKKIYKVVGKKKKSTRSSPQSANHPSSPASIEEYLYYFSDDADNTEENKSHDVIATTTTNKNGASSSDSRDFRIEKLVDAELNTEDFIGLY